MTSACGVPIQNMPCPGGADKVSKWGRRLRTSGDASRQVCQSGGFRDRARCMGHAALILAGELLPVNLSLRPACDTERPAVGVACRETRDRVDDPFIERRPPVGVRTRQGIPIGLRLARVVHRRIEFLAIILGIQGVPIGVAAGQPAVNDFLRRREPQPPGLPSNKSFTLSGKCVKEQLIDLNRELM